MRSHVYRNLHVKAWSLRDPKSGLVYAHAQRVEVINPICRVQMAGWRQTVVDHVRRVHAYAVGDVVTTDVERVGDWRRLHYNPFNAPYFVAEGDTRPLAGAERMRFDEGGAWCRGPRFKDYGPARVAVSGGRTSGMMLARVLVDCGGTLPDDVIPIFANTGEEAEGTLAFVHEMEQRWNVKIRWVEFTAKEPHWREVDYCTASRKGEPFDAMVRWKGRKDGTRGFVPNHFRRVCTEMLKGYPAAQLMKSLGYDPGDQFPLRSIKRGFTPRPPDYDELLGLRADEQRRLNDHRERHWMVFPLAASGVVKSDVLAFWAAQPFDLSIPDGEGNCRLCFEKGITQLVNVISAAPDEAGVERWIERERFAQGRMKENYSYEQLAGIARRQLPMFTPRTVGDSDSRPCMCAD